MAKQSWIRTIYLYAFALVGIVLIIVGGVDFVDMGLKAWVFTQAESDRRIDFARPPSAITPERAQELTEEGVELTAAERQQVQQWLSDYKQWQERRATVDPVTADRHRDAARNLAFILVGVPLYLYHWTVIKREKAGMA